MSIEKRALEENIRLVLTDDIGREIVKFCKDPHTSSEIIDNMLRKLSSTSSNRVWWERVVSESLRRLESATAITYLVEGKWKITEEARTVLEKFFGGL
jgi:hypothetical protein